MFIVKKIMDDLSFRQHVFDEIVRLVTIVVLTIFGVALVWTKSDLARDITLLLIGLVGGKYLKG